MALYNIYYSGIGDLTYGFSAHFCSKADAERVAEQEAIDEYSTQLYELSKSKDSNKKLSKAVKNICKSITDKTHISSNIKIIDGKKIKFRRT